MTHIAPIVEGSGEMQAVERLLWRIANEVRPDVRIRVNQPIRVKAGSFRNDPKERERHVLLAAAKARQHRGCVLVLLDCEDDCPATLGPQLAAQVRSIATDVPSIVALAVREYETWFIAAVESLRGVEGMSSQVVPPPDPESPRDAKGWLGHHMTHRYDPVAHQLPFTQHFDLQAARSVRSFDRLFRKIATLVSAEPEAQLP